MFGQKSLWGRPSIIAGWWVLFALASADNLAGQNLPLKRALPGTDSIACPEIDTSVSPGEEEMEQARRLGSDADQNLILGNQERARDLLARAVELDPTSAELAYRYGRILESLQETEPAIEQFCRALGLGSREQGIGDARPRLEALARAREPEIPEGARSRFLNALLQADLGNLEAADTAFGAAFAAVPDWPDAVYNRGVIRMRMGNREEAVADLQAYLDLHPNAADAILVSQRIGQLQTRGASSVSPGTALGLGLAIPGMGQFYSGRAKGGFSVLALAGGAVAAGYFIQKEEVRCVGTAPSGGCPADRIISIDKSRPYLVPSLAAAGAVAVIGAIEAYLKVRHQRTGGNDEVGAVDVGVARIVGPSVSPSGPGLHINLLRVTF